MFIKLSNKVVNALVVISLGLYCGCSHIPNSEPERICCDGNWRRDWPYGLSGQAYRNDLKQRTFTSEEIEEIKRERKAEIERSREEWCEKERKKEIERERQGYRNGIPQGMFTREEEEKIGRRHQGYSNDLRQRTFTREEK